MCGSGTIAIEAAMLGAGIAPGLSRTFDAERWDGFAAAWKHVREEAVAMQRPPAVVYASDVDKKALSAADRNAKAAGVQIKFARADVRNFSRECLVVTNPPYAARLGEVNEVHQLYRDMGRALWSVPQKFIITADEAFERYFGKRAAKRRKLYNGNIRCTLYQYT